MGSVLSYRRRPTPVSRSWARSCSPSLQMNSLPKRKSEEIETGEGFEAIRGPRTQETTLIGCEVHVWDIRAEWDNTRSRNCADCHKNGPGGRGKRELMYNALHSRGSRVTSRNCFDTLERESQDHVQRSSEKGSRAHQTQSNDLMRVQKVEDVKDDFIWQEG